MVWPGVQQTCLAWLSSFPPGAHYSFWEHPSVSTHCLSKRILETWALWREYDFGRQTCTGLRGRAVAAVYERICSKISRSAQKPRKTTLLIAGKGPGILTSSDPSHARPDRQAILLASQLRRRHFGAAQGTMIRPVSFAHSRGETSTCTRTVLLRDCLFQKYSRPRRCATSQGCRQQAHATDLKNEFRQDLLKIPGSQLRPKSTLKLAFKPYVDVFF